MNSNEVKEYKVLRPIGWNGRREKGAIIRLTEEEASAYSKDLITPVVAVAEVVDNKVKLEDMPLEDLKFAELKQLAENLKLDTSGTKADLLERIKLSRQ